MVRRKIEKLHNHVLHHSEIALLLIDVINDFDFPGSERIIEFALPAARKILTLKNFCREQGVPVIYVNDNFGTWRSDFKSVVRHCSSESSLGSEVSRLLKPEKGDYFVLKPKHSGFYSTTLQVLLSFLKCKRLILTGFAGNICVLFTANDAYMRDYEIFVPADCVASNTKSENQTALTQIKRVLKADTSHSSRMIRTLSRLLSVQD